MDKKLSILNLVLLITAGILVTWNIRIWMVPDYPSRVDGDSLVGSPKSLQEFSANRKTYSSSLISNIMGKNLFRKQREEFKVITENPPSKTSLPTLPPPEITVRGIMLLTNVQRAVLDGSYYIQGNNGKPELKSIKKKSYELNDYLGDYQIIKIEKKSVTIRGSKGNIITQLLARKSLTPIAREANLLYHKKKKVIVDDKVSVTQVNTLPQSSSEPLPQTVQSKSQEAKQPAPPPNQVKPPHVSGVKQRQTQNIGGNICGAKTRPTKQNKTHISGR